MADNFKTKKTPEFEAAEQAAKETAEFAKKIETMTFNDKVIALQNELKAPKSRYNSFGEFAYRSCEDIMEAVKPLCLKWGLMLNISDQVVYFGEGEKGRFYVKATATLTDGEHYLVSEGWAREAESKPKMDQAMLTGSSSSYSRKYALNGLLLIDDTKDCDTDEYSKQQGKRNFLAEISKIKDITDLEIWWNNNLDELKKQENYAEIRRVAGEKGKELQR